LGLVPNYVELRLDNESKDPQSNIGPRGREKEASGFDFKYSAKYTSWLISLILYTFDEPKG
jgi:hypothetical protein